MDIRVLKYFLTVAREESITRAAEVLHMTQPPLSRQLKDLKDEVGKQLLIRGGKRVTLTEDGMLLRKRAEEILDLFEKTKAELADSDKNITGEIYIGCGESDAVSFFAKAAKALQKEHPLIHYRIYSGDAERVMERLDRGLIDFGLLIGDVDIEKYDYLKLSISDTWGVLMRKDDPLTEKPEICAEDLWGKPLILSHQAASNSKMLSWLKADEVKPDVVVTGDLIYNVSHFVRNNIGYLICLDKILNITGESDLCFRPLTPKMEAALCIVWKKYQVFSKASKEFLRRLKAELSIN
ncbi:MAG: LysR family transcriptional regulator [Clostridiales bacterium]|nr:LysR family transcriptional regulator [Clostridiales bacterium]